MEESLGYMLLSFEGNHLNNYICYRMSEGYELF